MKSKKDKQHHGRIKKDKLRQPIADETSYRKRKTKQDKLHKTMLFMGLMSDTSVVIGE